MTPPMKMLSLAYRWITFAVIILEIAIWMCVAVTVSVVVSRGQAMCSVKQCIKTQTRWKKSEIEVSKAGVQRGRGVSARYSGRKKVSTP